MNILSIPAAGVVLAVVVVLVLVVCAALFAREVRQAPTEAELHMLEDVSDNEITEVVGSTD